MLIKTKIIAGMNRSLTRFAIPHATMDECLAADGKHLDTAKAVAAFSGDPSLFQLSDRDCDRSFWSAFTFCELMNDAFGRCVENPECDMRDHVESHADEKIAERIERKFCVIRQSILPTASGVSVTIRVDNPYNLVGQTPEEARGIAVTFVQLWLEIAKKTDNMEIKIVADEKMIERARDNNRRADIRHQYAFCERRHDCRTGEGVKLCSPCKFDCPLFRNGGRCAYEEECK